MKKQLIEKGWALKVKNRDLFVDEKATVAAVEDLDKDEFLLSEIPCLWPCKENAEIFAENNDLKNLVAVPVTITYNVETENGQV